MKLWILIAMYLLGSSAVRAQDDGSKKRTETIVILTSAQCKQCKERLEGVLNYTKGIVFSELDIVTKKITVKYKVGVITADQIRQKIAETGYDADEVKAVQKNVDKLPACCKPGGMEK